MEVLKAEARAQPSLFTVPTDPQEEIRLLRARWKVPWTSCVGCRSSGRHARGNNGHEVARLCHVMGTAATRSTVSLTPSMVSNAVQLIVSWVIHHLCGFQVCRVGEASNPGPVVTRQGSRFLAFHDTHVSSDEELLVRPNTGRHVIARVEASLVPATSEESRKVCGRGHWAHGCTDTIVDDLEWDLTESQLSRSRV